MYKLFIDDERFPLRNDWKIARTSNAAIRIVYENGMPQEISFDHDLGGDDTVMQFLKWLANYMLDHSWKFPRNFTYSVHSQNPVGVQNIKGYMNNLLKIIGKE
jgi:hypothetical protein